MRIRGRTSHSEAEPRAAHMKEASGNSGALATASPLVDDVTLTMVVWDEVGDGFLGPLRRAL